MTWTKQGRTSQDWYKITVNSETIWDSGLTLWDEDPSSGSRTIWDGDPANTWVKQPSISQTWTKQ